MDPDLQPEPSAAAAPIGGRLGKRRNPQMRLQVCVSCDEAKRVEKAASSAGMSVSAYLRALGLGYRPMAVIDLDEAQKLNHLGSNLGRLGGLLKLWISDGPRPERYSQAEFRKVIDGLINQVRANQEEMQRLSKRVLRAHPSIRRSRDRREPDDDGVDA